MAFEAGHLQRAASPASSGRASPVYPRSRGRADEGKELSGRQSQFAKLPPCRDLQGRTGKIKVIADTRRG